MYPITGHERVHLAHCRAADTPFHIQEYKKKEVGHNTTHQEKIIEDKYNS